MRKSCGAGWSEGGATTTCDTFFFFFQATVHTKQKKKKKLWHISIGTCIVQVRTKLINMQLGLLYIDRYYADTCIHCNTYNKYVTMVRTSNVTKTIYALVEYPQSSHVQKLTKQSYPSPQ